MSYSQVIKEEMCRLEAVKDCCMRAELSAVYHINNAGGAPPGGIVTENAAVARRIYNLAKILNYPHPVINVNKKLNLKKNAVYSVHTGECAPLSQSVKKKCCKKAALRGMFLAGGSITDPEKLYHLEIYCKNIEMTRYIAGLMSGFNLNPKIMERIDYNVVYIKDSEQIVNFLNITGAHRALLSLENTRILKDVRNGVNRAVNCETANLEKIVNASLRQTACIAYIKDMIGFDALPANLREIAELRYQNREISLKELGLILSPPLGKSGVNHRMRKLESIAAELQFTSTSS